MRTGLAILVAGIFLMLYEIYFMFNVVFIVGFLCLCLTSITWGFVAFELVDEWIDS